MLSEDFFMRELTSEDIAEMSSLHAMCLEVSYTQSFYERLLSSEGRVCLGVFSKECRLVGVTLSFIGCQTPFDFNPLRQCWDYLVGEMDSCFILTLCVNPAYRRLGIARALISHVIEVAMAAPCKRAILHCLTTNVAAIELYKSVGFEIYKLNVAYYNIKDINFDAYELVLKLIESQPSIIDRVFRFPYSVLEYIWGQKPSTPS